jgi:hypothetical protein
LVRGKLAQDTNVAKRKLVGQSLVKRALAYVARQGMPQLHRCSAAGVLAAVKQRDYFITNGSFSPPP